MAQKLSKKLEDGMTLLGTHVSVNNSFVTEMLAGCGFDFIWIDAEHSALERADIQSHLVACRAAGTAGIVRVPSNDAAAIKGVLDMGADGVIIPMVNTLEDAKAAVAATHYPPYGIRGMGLRRAANYGLWDKNDYLEHVEQNVWTLVQIEHIDAMKDLEEIAALPGITGFVVGPNDFAVSMNTSERRCTPNDPDVNAYYDEIGRILSATGKPFGVSGIYSEQFVTDWIRRGVNFLSMNFDFHYLTMGGKQVHSCSKMVLEQLGKRCG